MEAAVEAQGAMPIAAAEPVTRHAEPLPAPVGA
jgi:hypothetical protein